MLFFFSVLASIEKEVEEGGGRGRKGRTKEGRREGETEQNRRRSTANGR